MRPGRKFPAAWALAALWPAVCGCIPQRVALTVTDSASTQPGGFRFADYALALRRSVKPEGVDYHALLADPALLDLFLARLAYDGPRSQPERFARREDRLAYWINAYNAAVLRGVVQQCGNGTVPDWPWISLDYGYLFRVDGRMRVPAELRRAALAEAGDDWRVRFALCGGRRGDPPLAREPFQPDVLEFQIDRQVRDAWQSSHCTVINHGDQYLLLSGDLLELQSRLIADFEKRTGARGATILNVLIERATREHVAVLNSAIGYSVHRLPFDGRVNQAQTAGQAPGLLSRILSSVTP